MSEYRHPSARCSPLWRYLRGQRIEALTAARTCHPAEVGIFVRLARLSHRRILQLRGITQ